MKEHKEADITISGQRLTEAQSMTIRVAIGDFAIFCRDNAKGDEDSEIFRLYLERIKEIEALISKTAC